MNDNLQHGKKKSKAVYEARAARQAEVSAVLAQRHLLCVNGDPNQPITVDLPPGTRIEPEFLATFARKKSAPKRPDAD